MADSVNLGTVHVGLEMRLQKFRDGIRDGKRDLASFEQSLTRFGDNMQRVGQKMSLAVTAPLLLLGKQAIKTAGEMDALERGMASMMGSATAASREIAKLKEVAKLPGLGFEDAVKGSVRLQGMGASAEDARRILLAFGNAIARTGGGVAELDGVTRALGQTLAKGKIQMEEVLQLAERQIPVFQAMKNIWGTADTEALQKMGVTAEEFVKKLTEFFGAQEKVGNSAKNKIENLGQAWDMFIGKIGKVLLDGGLEKAIEGFTAKLENAVTWFNKLDPAAQTAFTNMTIALAASGPLMVGIGGLIKGITGIGTALAFLARNPLIAALLAGGAATAFMAGPGGDAIQSGMNRWLDNFKQSLGITGPEPPMPKVGPFAPRSSMLRPLGEVMRPDAAGGFNLRDFIPGLPPKPGTASRPGKKPPPAAPDPEAARRARELLSANMDLLADLNGEEARIMREAQRMRSRGLRSDLVQRWIQQQMAPLLRKRNEIMMGNVLRQGKEEAREFTISPQSPQFNVPSLSGLRNLAPQTFPGSNAWASFGAWIAEQRRQFFPPEPAPSPMSVISAAAFGAGNAPKQPKARDIEMQAMPTIKKLGFNLGEELGNNMAQEMGRAFGDMFDRIFGAKNPLTRALSRTLSRLVDDVMYTLAQRAFGQNLILSLFGGSGGLAGTGAGTTVGALGLGAGAVGPPVFKAAGAKAGSAFGAAFAAKAAIAIGAMFAVGAGLNALLGGKGRFNVNTIGEKIFPQAPSLGSAFAAGAYGNQYININMPGVQFNNDMDVKRTSERLAWHTGFRMRSR